MTLRIPPNDIAQRRLLAAGWLFAVGSPGHIFDHLRRGNAEPVEELVGRGRR